jgi:taurine transport system permease protein
VRGICDPIIQFYRPLPPLAYLPLVIIWLGIGEVSKVFLIFLAIFAPMAIAAAPASARSPSSRCTPPTPWARAAARSSPTS